MPDTKELIFRLLLAAFCAGLVGIERERKTWAAGMRTHMLVGLGSALFMMVSSFGFSEIRKQSNVDLDPSRVAAQVVSGIGFLGAGTIFFLGKGIVRGLTTASGLWTVAGVGLAIGGGMYAPGVCATVIAIAILWLLKPLEAYLFPKHKRVKIKTVLDGEAATGALISDLTALPGESSLKVSLDKTEQGWSLTIHTKNDQQVKNVMEILKRYNVVSGISVEKLSSGS